MVHAGSHGTPSRGTPSQAMAANNQIASIDPHRVPSADEAVRQFEEDGGHLTHFSSFGEDPLSSDPSRVRNREAAFHHRYPQFDPFFHGVVNDDDSLFRQGLNFFIHLTQSM